MSTDLEELRNLPVADKLRIVEQLWDGIDASREPILIQEWHETEARKRAVELGAQPDLALTREELWRRVDGFDG